MVSPCQYLLTPLKMQSALCMPASGHQLVADNAYLETSRWKAVTLRDGDSMLVYGGDPLGADGLKKVYLNDVWRLSLADGFKTPLWQQLQATDGTYNLQHAFW